MKVPVEEKTDWAIEILGLEEYRYRKPKNLSGGRLQRVALGRAIVARVSKYEVSQIGDEIKFVFMPHKIHFFDVDTEQMIPADE